MAETDWTKTISTMVSTGVEAVKGFAGWVAEQVSKLASNFTASGDTKPKTEETPSSIVKNAKTELLKPMLTVLDTAETIGKTTTQPELVEKSKQMRASVNRIVTDDKVEKVVETFKTTLTSELKKKSLSTSDFEDANGNALDESKLSESAKQALTSAKKVATKVATEEFNKTIKNPIFKDYEQHIQSPSTPARDTPKEGRVHK